MLGYVGSITRDRIEGWPWDPATPETPVVLATYDNGITIGEIRQTDWCCQSNANLSPL